MVNGGNDGIRIAPVGINAKSASRKSQIVEWRCVSFREERMVETGGKEQEEENEAVAVDVAVCVLTDSSGTDGAEQDCAACLEVRKEMMGFLCLSRGT